MSLSWYDGLSTFIIRLFLIMFNLKKMLLPSEYNKAIYLHLRRFQAVIIKFFIIAKKCDEIFFVCQ